MSEKRARLEDYLMNMEVAAAEARSFVENMTEAEFLADRKTQNAVVMSLIVIGEAAARIAEVTPDFIQQHSNVRWREMRGMRNRITHGYFGTDFELVWKTVQIALPELLGQLPALMEAARAA
ncbi:DUF86 domain-containing protein [Labrys miyagiensis]|uniref:DUF86 domain-containing protein n=2 Tax=Labrys miyagiensis TaxID=346912 RepID=A0ABQ6CGW4_9HYPH|nr:DUF86 domain-containing protein [Labrys miyagiensis]